MTELDTPREHDERTDESVVAEIFRGATERRGYEDSQASPDELRERNTADTDAATEAEREDWRQDHWKQAEPELREEWRQHEERYPEADRPPVDRSQDKEGDWRGESGDWMMFEENLVTENGHHRVRQAEWPVTKALREIAAELEDGRLAGLEYRLKGLERYKEKVAADLREFHDSPDDMPSVSEVIGGIADAMRYTVELKHDAYAGGYDQVRLQMEGRGFEMIMSRNSWDNAEYKGINTRWRTADGQIFEVQFHSPDSLAAKQLTHGAYERLRNPLTSDAEITELKAYQQKVSGFVTVPTGAPGIPDYRKEGY
jgi:hypothetical protein